MDANDRWKAQTTALGAFIRAQRAVADLSLREMATMTNVSNAYLSQIERGLHAPSVRVLRAIADALRLPADQLLAQAGLLTAEAEQPTPRTAAAGSAEPAILADPALSEEQRRALLSVYRSFVPRD